MATSTLPGRPHTGPDPIMRRLDWSFPAPPVERELVSVLPDEPTDRPPLLFVHGLAHAAWCWQEHWMPAAADRGWPTYALSLRGHGASEGAEDLWKAPIRFFEHDVLQAITRLPSRPVLVGHSMGGLVVQRVLARYQARAGVLVAPVAGTHGFGMLAKLAGNRPLEVARALVGLPIRPDAGLLFGEHMDPVKGREYAERMVPDSRVAQYEMVLPRRLQPTRSPVLVMGGGDDSIVPPVDLVRTARHYRTRARLFRGMGHDLMLDAGWEAALDVMLRWLDETLT